MRWFHRIMGWIFSATRVLMGWLWISSGYDKLSGGFGVESLVPVVAANTDSPDWYKVFFQNIVHPLSPVFDILIPVGEIMIGAGLIIGLLTLPALLFSVFVHVNYILADMVFTYPVEIMISAILLSRLGWTTNCSLERLLYPQWRRKFGWKHASAKPEQRDVTIH